MIRIVVFFISLFSVIFVYSQKNYWQQSIKYNMVIDFDHENHQFSGNQSIKYYNNSPDKINKVYSYCTKDSILNLVSWLGELKDFNYKDCLGHPAWLEQDEWLGSSMTKQFPLQLISGQPNNRLHSQLDNGSESQKYKIFR